MLQFFGEPGLGRPDLDLQHEMARLQAWIAARNLPEQISVTGAVVLTHPEALLTAKDTPYPVLTASQVADFLRQGLTEAPVLSTATQKELRRTLDEVVQSRTKQ